MKNKIKNIILISTFISSAHILTNHSITAANEDNSQTSTNQNLDKEILDIFSKSPNELKISIVVLNILKKNYDNIDQADYDVFLKRITDLFEGYNYSGNSEAIGYRNYICSLIKSIIYKKDNNPTYNNDVASTNKDSVTSIAQGSEDIGKTGLHIYTKGNVLKTIDDFIDFLSKEISNNHSIPTNVSQVLQDLINKILILNPDMNFSIKELSFDNINLKIEEYISRFYQENPDLSKEIKNSNVNDKDVGEKDKTYVKNKDVDEKDKKNNAQKIIKISRLSFLKDFLEFINQPNNNALDVLYNQKINHPHADQGWSDSLLERYSQKLWEDLELFIIKKNNIDLNTKLENTFFKEVETSPKKTFNQFLNQTKYIYELYYKINESIKVHSFITDDNLDKFSQYKYKFQRLDSQTFYRFLQEFLQTKIPEYSYYIDKIWDPFIEFLAQKLGFDSIEDIEELRFFLRQEFKYENLNQFQKTDIFKEFNKPMYKLKKYVDSNMKRFLSLNNVSNMTNNQFLSILGSFFYRFQCDDNENTDNPVMLIFDSFTDYFIKTFFGEEYKEYKNEIKSTIFDKFYTTFEKNITPFLSQNGCKLYAYINTEQQKFKSSALEIFKSLNDSLELSKMPEINISIFYKELFIFMNMYKFDNKDIAWQDFIEYLEIKYNIRIKLPEINDDLHKSLKVTGIDIDGKYFINKGLSAEFQRKMSFYKDDFIKSTSKNHHENVNYILKEYQRLNEYGSDILNLDKNDIMDKNSKFKEHNINNIKLRNLIDFLDSNDNDILKEDIYLANRIEDYLKKVFPKQELSFDNIPNLKQNILDRIKKDIKDINGNNIEDINYNPTLQNYDNLGIFDYESPSYLKSDQLRFARVFLDYLDRVGIMDFEIYREGSKGDLWYKFEEHFMYNIEIPKVTQKEVQIYLSQYRDFFANLLGSNYSETRKKVLDYFQLSTDKEDNNVFDKHINNTKEYIMAKKNLEKNENLFNYVISFFSSNNEIFVKHLHDYLKTIDDELELELEDVKKILEDDKITKNKYSFQSHDINNYLDSELSMDSDIFKLLANRINLLLGSYLSPELEEALKRSGSIEQLDNYRHTVLSRDDLKFIIGSGSINDIIKRMKLNLVNSNLKNIYDAYTKIFDLSSGKSNIDIRDIDKSNIQYLFNEINKGGNYYISKKDLQGFSELNLSKDKLKLSLIEETLKGYFDKPSTSVLSSLRKNLNEDPDFLKLKDHDDIYLEYYLHKNKFMRNYKSSSDISKADSLILEEAIDSLALKMENPIKYINDLNKEMFITNINKTASVISQLITQTALYDYQKFLEKDLDAKNVDNNLQNHIINKNPHLKNIANLQGAFSDIPNAKYLGNFLNLVTLGIPSAIINKISSSIIESEYDKLAPENRKKVEDFLYANLKYNQNKILFQPTWLNNLNDIIIRDLGRYKYDNELEEFNQQYTKLSNAIFTHNTPDEIGFTEDDISNLKQSLYLLYKNKDNPDVYMSNLIDKIYELRTDAEERTGLLKNESSFERHQDSLSEFLLKEANLRASMSVMTSLLSLVSPYQNLNNLS